MSGAAAAVGLLLTAAQLRLQNRIARLEQLDGVDELWQRTKDEKTTLPDEWTLGEASRLLVDEYFRDVSRKLQLELHAPKPEELADVRAAPWILAFLMPLYPATRFGATGPKSYRQQLTFRSQMLFGLLRRLTEAAEEGSPGVADDLERIEGALHAYLTRLNDFSDRFESSAIDRRRTLAKFHANLVRAAYYFEPYVLWQNREADAPPLYMRTLSLASAARRFHWDRIIQQGNIRPAQDDNAHIIQKPHFGPPRRLLNDWLLLGRQLAWPFTDYHRVKELTYAHNLLNDQRSLAEISGTEVASSATAAEKPEVAQQ